MAQYDRFPLQGGLDLSTPYIARDPGTLLQSQNYEPDTDGGYRVMAGYERYDGRPAPSAATLYEVRLSAPTGTSGTWSYGTAWETSTATNNFYIVEQPTGGTNTLWIDVVDTPPAVGTLVRAVGTTTPTYTVQSITQVLPDANNIIGATYDDGYILNARKIGDITVPLIVAGTIVRGMRGAAEVATGQVRYIMDPNTNGLADTLIYVTVLTGDFATATSLTADGTAYSMALLRSGEMESYLQDPYTPQGALWAAQEQRRSRIRPVPLFSGAGTFPVSGVWDFRGTVYAIRDYVGGVNARMYRATPNGWQTVNLGFTLGWDSRPSTVTDLNIIKGDTITGATSGATATVGFVGYIDQEHNTGYISMVSYTGVFAAGENLVINTIVVGKVTAAPTANQLPAGGFYRFFNHNFAAGLDQYSMYAANGVGPAFAFDGVNFVFIYTGVPDALNKPFEVKVHYDHLFLAFDNGSLQHSVVGNPLDWSGGTGALEVGIGANITDLIITPKSLIICSEKDIQVLLGTGLDDWTKDVITTHTGVRRFTGQYQSMAYVMARPGMIAIDRVDSFGNFADAVISDKIRDLITTRYDLWGPGIADKTKSQYRLFGSDGLNLVFSVYQGELKGIMAFRYDIPVRNAANPNGRILFTSDTGYVYQSDVGPSNDGAERVVYVRTSYANQGDPDTRKRFKRCAISITGSVFREMGVSFAFDKGRSDTPNSFISDMVNGAGGRWALNDWDRIYWDGPDVEEIRKDMDGVGSDVSMIIYQSSRAANVFILEDVSFEYEPRRKVR